MDLFNTILWWVNIAIIIFVASFFIFQLFFMLVCYLRPRKYKKAKKYHDFTVIIRAHNEEDVIADSVDAAMACDYPEDKKHVIVFCHNCTDKTAEIARAHGARAVEFTDKDPKHAKASYCMKLGMNELKKDLEGTYEYFLLLDADNQVDKNYIRACNDAADEGVELGRTYENSKNLTDNLISCMHGLWYARDDRFDCCIRSALHMGVVMNGCCSMIKAEYCLDWDAMSSSDDIEFTLNRLIKDGKIVEFISEAIIYEDQPTTIDDMFKRNTRMGNGLFRLFFTTGIHCLNCFFRDLFKKDVPFGTKMSYFDQYTNLGIIPASLVASFWFPVYYIYMLFWTGFVGPVTIPGLGSYDLMWFVLFIVIVASCCFLVPFFLQPTISYFTERKKLIIKKKSVVFWSIVLYPCYILLDLVSIIKGIFMKPKWGKVKRSTTKIEQK